MAVRAPTLQELAAIRAPRLDPTRLPLESIRRQAPTSELLARVTEAVGAFDPRAAGPGAPSAPRARPSTPADASALVASFGPFSLDVVSGRVTVREQGVDRWVIDTAHFGGAPTLDATGGPHGADIVLRDAWYPGTTIPASLKARIREESGSWRIRLRLDFGHFDATAPLSPWLNRTVFAAAAVRPSLECCPLGPTSALAAGGLGVAGFTPDWLLLAIGPGLFRLEGVEPTVTADFARITRVLSGGSPFFLPQAWRRTQIELASPGGFPLQPTFATDTPRVHLGGFAFQSLALEAGLDPSGDPHRLLLAESPASETMRGLETGGDLCGGEGEPLRVPLAGPRFFELFDRSRSRTSAIIVGELPADGFWAHSAGVSLRLARHEQYSMAGIVEVAPNPPAGQLVTRLVATAPRVRDVLVRPEPAQPRDEMRFGWEPASEVLPPYVGRVEIDAAAGTATVILPEHASVAFVRRDDFAALRVAWPAMRYWSRGGERRLVPASDLPPHLVIELPPQSIGEETFFEADPSYTVAQSGVEGAVKDEATKQENTAGALPAPPVKALLAKPSRLVFRLEPGESFPITEDTLLDWDLPPSLAPNALPGGQALVLPGRPPLLLPAPEVVVRPAPPALARPQPAAAIGDPAGAAAAGFARVPMGNRRPPASIRLPAGASLKPAAPSSITTAIELPFRLLLSPNVFAAWRHASAPVTRDGRTELWHTRLATRVGDAVTEDAHPHRTMRAIWSRDHDFQADFDRPFLMPLDWDDRRQIVHVTSDFELSPFVPVPVAVNRLMLSSLGGWLDSDLRLEPPEGYAVEQWRHRATLGRDHFVRVVYKGFLFPFGHRASLVKISERKIQPTPHGDPAAYLRMRLFLVVREPERTFQGPGYAHAGRETPFRRVRITTIVTPNLNPPQESMLDPVNGRPLGAPLGTPPVAGFWPRVGPADFHFHLKAWDWEQREIDLLMPLAFVRSDLLDTAGVARAVEGYNKEQGAGRRTRPLGGQRVALAEAAGYAGKTTFDTSAVTFAALAPADGTREPPCYPRLQQAQVTVVALRQMTGGNPLTTIELDQTYLQHGFDPASNRAGLFARLPAAPALDFKAAGSADRSGGVATPSLRVRGLSREVGTVGDTGADLAKGHFDPHQFFSGLDAQLFGGIRLADILEALTPADFLSQAPKLVTKNAADELVTTLSWQTTRLQTFGPFVRHGGTALFLDSIMRTAKAGGAQTFKLEGRIHDFSIDLAGVIVIGFDLFRFTSVDGRKPDVHVEVRDIRFAGALTFLNRLQPILSPEHFADPPYLDISPQGISAGYNLTIPGVGVGVFALQNLALGARLTLPFTGDPMRVRFNLSERQSPFIVSVAPFGGGGFFAIAVGVDGVEVLEASIEFGGNISVDLGVASGGVSLMAGIYLRIDVSSNQSELTGYLRANGALSVLGVVTLSLEFYFGLTYNMGSGKAWGEARVRVEISVLIFSGSVTVRMRRQFAGSTGDPPFGEMMPHPRWAAYAAAFA